MMRSRLSWMVTLGVLTVVACGDEVVTSFGDDGTGGSQTDPKCYDDCIKKGETPETCTDYCGEKGTGGSQTNPECYADCIEKGETPENCVYYCSEKGTGGSGAASSGSGGTTTSSGTGGVDPESNKPCIQCWYDEDQTNGACTAEAMACEYSLACTQLQWCPLLCDKTGCIEECNAIIPTGVADLTALVQCAVCNGGPCADECQDSVFLYYCE
ncbi:MAG: hypothetical protein JRI68_10130 [Deltaproteobacteria bacterium]|nr:hypothetical protein [Deltaproteobacteria bacterium]